MHVPTELPIDDGATWWSVPPAGVAAAIATRPLVVLLHGLGADELDLAGMVPALPPELLYASVRAPLPIRSPGRGFAWFPPGLADGAGPDPQIADAAARGLLTWLERTQARARTHGPVALLGFSQGAAMAVQTLRHAPESVAAVVALSGFASSGPVAGDEALAQIRPPVLWGHDPADPVVPSEHADRLGAFLRAHTDVVERRYPDAGHGITLPEAQDVAAFLRGALTA